MNKIASSAFGGLAKTLPFSVFSDSLEGRNPVLPVLSMTYLDSSFRWNDDFEAIHSIIGLAV